MTTVLQRSKEPDITNTLFLDVSSLSTNEQVYQAFKEESIRLYIDNVIMPRNRPSDDIILSYAPLYGKVEQNDFTQILSPVLVRQTKRNPDCLVPITALLNGLDSKIDTTPYFTDVTSTLFEYATSKTDSTRMSCIDLLTKRGNVDVLRDVLVKKSTDLIKKGSNNWYEKHGAYSIIGCMGEFLSMDTIKNSLIVLLNDALEKERAKEVLEAGLKSVSLIVSRSPSLLAEFAKLFGKGIQDSSNNTIYYVALYKCLEKVSSSKCSEKIDIGPMEKTLVDIVKSSKQKQILVSNALKAYYVLLAAARTQDELKQRVYNEKLFDIIFSPESYIFAKNFTDASNTENLSVLVRIFEVIFRFNLDLVVESSSSQEIFQLFLKLILFSPKVTKQQAVWYIPYCTTSPAFSSNILKSFEEYYLPQYQSMEESNLKPTSIITASILRGLVSPNLSVEEKTRVILLAHHESIILKKRNVLKGVSKKIDQKGIQSFIISNIAVILRILLEESKSSSVVYRRAACYAISYVGSIKDVSDYVLEKLAELINHDKCRKIFTLNDEEVFIYRTPRGQNFKQVELDEYIPSIEPKKKSGDEDDAAYKKQLLAYKKQQEVISAKLLKLEQEEIVREDAIRDRIDQFYLDVENALRILTYLANDSPSFFNQESHKVYHIFVNLHSLANITTDLQASARWAASRIIHNFVDSSYNRNALYFGFVYEKYCELVSNAINHIKSISHSNYSRNFFYLIQNIFLSGIYHDIEVSAQNIAIQELVQTPYFNKSVLKGMLQTINSIPEYETYALESLLKVSWSPTHELHLEAFEYITKEIFHKNASVRNALLKSMAGIENLPAFGHVEEVTIGLWILTFDTPDNSEIAAKIRKDHAEYNLKKDFLQPIIKVLENSKEKTLQNMAIDSLSGAIDIFPDEDKIVLNELINIYNSNKPIVEGDEIAFKTSRNIPKAVDYDHLIAKRKLSASLLKSFANVKTLSVDLAVTIFKFLFETALCDTNPDVYQDFLDAGIAIIDTYGKTLMSTLHDIFNSQSNISSEDEVQDRVKEALVLFTGTLGQHLTEDDPQLDSVIKNLLDALLIPSEKVQKQVSNCFSRIGAKIPNKAESVLKVCIEMCTKGEDYGIRLGGAYGLSGIVHGLKLPSLRKHKFIMEELEKAASDKRKEAREGSSMAFELLSLRLGAGFEPWVIKILQYLLDNLGYHSEDVRRATLDASKAIMTQLTKNGINVVLPPLLRSLESTSSKWRATWGVLEMIGCMAECQPQQLSHYLTQVVPRLSELSNDTRVEIRDQTKKVLDMICSLIKNEEIRKISPFLLKALYNSDTHGAAALDALANTHFVNRIDETSLSLIMPVVIKSIRDRSTDTKRKALKIIGSMSALTNPAFLKPYEEDLLDEMKIVLKDPIPDTRAIAAKALGLIAKDLQSTQSVLAYLLQKMESPGIPVDRAGAAQGLSQVLSHMDTQVFATELLPHILSKCTSDNVNAREGFISLFRYLPDAFEARLETMVDSIIVAIIQGLADENDSVRGTSLKAGQAIVSKYGTDKIDLFIDVLKNGLFEENWRIRLSSLQLTSDFIYQVTGANEDFSNKNMAVMFENQNRSSLIAALYILRLDDNVEVHDKANITWKTLITNTTQVLRKVMSNTLDIIITHVSDGSKQSRACKALSDVVTKLGEEGLKFIISAIKEHVEHASIETKVGLCVGMKEIFEDNDRNVIVSQFDLILNLLKTPICDDSEEVRTAASNAFQEFHRQVGNRAIDETLPDLLKRMENEDQDVSEKALNGLQQILVVNSQIILPVLLPKLLVAPLTSFNLRALATVANASGKKMNIFLNRVLSPLFNNLYVKNTSNASKEELQDTLENIVLAIEPTASNDLFKELYKHTTYTSPAVRAGAFSMIRLYTEENGRNSVYQQTFIDLIVYLLRGYHDRSRDVVDSAVRAFTTLSTFIDTNLLSGEEDFVQAINDTIDTLRVPDTLEGLESPDGLRPILPIYEYVIRNGEPEQRKTASYGLRIIIEKCSDDALTADILKDIVGPLIRILSERTLDSDIRLEILTTMNLIIERGGIKVKKYGSIFQTIYIKALLLSSKNIRLTCARGLAAIFGLLDNANNFIKELTKTLKDNSLLNPDGCLSTVAKVGMNVKSKVQEPVYHGLEDIVSVYTDSDDPIVRKFAMIALERLHGNFVEEYEEEDL